MKYSLEEFLEFQAWVKDNFINSTEESFKTWIRLKNLDIRPNHRNLDRLDVLPLSFLTELKGKHKTNQYFTFGESKVKITSERYHVFKKSVVCCECGLKGSFLGIERQPLQNGSFHLNLYGIDDNKEEVLFTKDHIIPKSKGGKNEFSNYQTMCSKCNERKGDCS